MIAAVYARKSTDLIWAVGGVVLLLVVVGAGVAESQPSSIACVVSGAASSAYDFRDQRWKGDILSSATPPFRIHDEAAGAARPREFIFSRLNSDRPVVRVVFAGGEANESTGQMLTSRPDAVVLVFPWVRDAEWFTAAIEFKRRRAVISQVESSTVAVAGTLSIAECR
jgi:hypothetical protein